MTLWENKLKILKNY